MPFLLNPGGRIVEVNHDKYEYWLSKDGFKKLSIEKSNKFATERAKKIWELKNSHIVEEMAKKGVYLATVSPGGKDGYGVASDLLVRELSKLDLPTHRTYMKQKIGILFHNPYSINMLQTPIRIIYTMFESTKIPQDFLPYLAAADYVFVPSQWCKEVFEAAGVENVKVIPLGYDQDVYKFVDRGETKASQHKKFTFLHHNAYNIRKGFLEVYKAFTKAFSPDEPVELIMKTVIDNPQSRFPYLTPTRNPNIRVIQGKLSAQKMHDLMAESDCFVFPSRGEGFGMTPVEAMATGLPAIVPNAHGISEYFDASVMYEAKVKETCPAIYSRYKNQDVGTMVVCDVDQLASQMRYVYEHQEEAREKGRLASEYIKQWSFEETAKLLASELKPMLDKPVPKRKIRDLLPLKKI